MDEIVLETSLGIEHMLLFYFIYSSLYNMDCVGINQ